MVVPLGWVPLIINPIYTLCRGYVLGISPFKGLLGGVKQQGYHPKGTRHFPLNNPWEKIHWFFHRLNWWGFEAELALAICEFRCLRSCRTQTPPRRGSKVFLGVVSINPYVTNMLVKLDHLPQVG